MRFRVHKLVSGPVGKTQHEALDLGPTRFDDDLQVTTLRGPLTFVRINDSILVGGHIKTTTIVQCVRSLEDFELPITIDFASVEFLLPTAAPGPTPDVAINDENIDRLISDDGWLDLAELLREEIVMAIPINPISPRYSRAESGLPDDLDLTAENDWLTVRWKKHNGDSGE